MQTATQTDLKSEETLPAKKEEVAIKYINPNTDRVEMPTDNFASIAWPTP